MTDHPTFGVGGEGCHRQVIDQIEFPVVVHQGFSPGVSPLPLQQLPRRRKRCVFEGEGRQPGSSAMVPLGEIIRSVSVLGERRTPRCGRGCQLRTFLGCRRNCYDRRRRAPRVRANTGRHFSAGGQRGSCTDHRVAGAACLPEPKPVEQVHHRGDVPTAAAAREHAAGVELACDRSKACRAARAYVIDDWRASGREALAGAEGHALEARAQRARMSAVKPRTELIAWYERRGYRRGKSRGDPVWWTASNGPRLDGRAARPDHGRERKMRCRAF